MSLVQIQYSNTLIVNVLSQRIWHNNEIHDTMSLITKSFWSKSIKIGSYSPNVKDFLSV